MNLQEQTNRIKQMMGVIKESEDKDLILYHGSNTTKIFDIFKDNQFYTENDYIASNYAYNFGGVMYKVSVDNLNSFDLKGYHEDKESEEHNMMTGLLMDLYGQNAVDYYKDYYFNPSPSVIFSEKGWSPIIEWAKDNGYDSIKFIDESFDTYVRGISYVIFDGNKPIITNVYDVTEAVESNFKKDFTTII